MILSKLKPLQAKKTQRDKDWTMIRHLVEAHYFENCAKPAIAQLKFWFLELRTPEPAVVDNPAMGF